MWCYKLTIMKSILYILCCSILFYSYNKHKENKNKGSKIKLISANYSCSTPEITDVFWYTLQEKKLLYLKD